jgi:hypothetical protein
LRPTGTLRQRLIDAISDRRGGPWPFEPLLRVQWGFNFRTIEKSTTRACVYYKLHEGSSIDIDPANGHLGLTSFTLNFYGKPRPTKPLPTRPCQQL